MTTSPREQERLAYLRSSGLLERAANAAMIRVPRLAARVFGVPMAFISLVDAERQWFKASVGLDIDSTERGDSFCQHTIEHRNPTVVEDAHFDQRFAGSPLVSGSPFIRFYAGAPLTLDGHAVGTLCIADSQPRHFDEMQRLLLADLAELVVADLSLQRLAGHVHEVTRLPNRAQLNQDLLDASTDSRAAGAPHSIAVVDVISNANVQAAVRAVGVAPMEAVLRVIADKLSAAMKDGDALYHISDTRFVVLFSEGEWSVHNARAHELHALLRKPFESDGVLVQLDLGMGLAHFALDKAAARDALRRALTALYQADVEQIPILWHSTAIDEPQRRAYRLLRSIPPGLAKGEFRLVYQPKFNARLRRFTGVEALARWNSESEGAVSPGEFVPLLEQTALIHDFTKWVLHTALAQIAAWRHNGLDLTVAVNVSSRNLEHPLFISVLRSALDLYGVPADRLHVEVTETATIVGTKSAAALEEIRSMGIPISLDDFGVGYSNFACLQSLPVQLLKIDQSLVHPIAEQPRALQLVRSLIQLGHALGYRMLAEGIESREVMELLEAEGCDAMQGYFLSRPIEADLLPDFIATALDPLRR